MRARFEILLCVSVRLTVINLYESLVGCYMWAVLFLFAAIGTTNFRPVRITCRPDGIHSWQCRSPTSKSDGASSLGRIEAAPAISLTRYDKKTAHRNKYIIYFTRVLVIQYTHIQTKTNKTVYPKTYKSLRYD